MKLEKKYLMSGHVISQGILNLINPGFTNEKMEEPSELVFASFNQGMVGKKI